MRYFHPVDGLAGFMAQQCNFSTDCIMLCWTMYKPSMNWTRHFISSTVVAELSLTWVCFHCSTLFTELRILLEHFIMKPACPVFFRRICLSSIAFISRLAPTGVWFHLDRFLAFFFFSLTIWNFNGHRHFYQQNYFLECQHYSLRFSWMVWVQLKIYRNIMVIITSPVFNVTSFKQWIQLLVYPAWIQ